jgi:hypothetical protein
MVDRIETDQGWTRMAKTPELRSSMFLAMRRFIFASSGTESGGRKISSGVCGFMTMVSASNQLLQYQT